MTATDLHATALALIAERRGLIAAGTPGPWGQVTSEGIGIVSGVQSMTLATTHHVSGIPQARRDAALIVAAVNDYGPLLDLAEYTLTVTHPLATDPILGDHCTTCLHLAVTYDDWPCPDATAALRSLGLVTT